jgi:glycosyltransferase involved in cell wall biosynthesis
MEAMARALPVVAYRVGGLPERLPPEAAPWLAQPGDRDGLADRLRRLLADPQQAAVLGRANRRASRSFPTWQESGRRVWALLGRLTAVGAAEAPSTRCAGG